MTSLMDTVVSIDKEDESNNSSMIKKYSEYLSDDSANATDSSEDEGKETKQKNDKLGEKSENFDLMKTTEGNSKTRNEKQSKTEKNYFRNLYIKNFGDDLDSCELRKMFQKFGFISSAVVETDEAGNSKGFGFVCFESSASARLAIDEMNGIDLNGRKLYVGQFMKKSERKQLVNNPQRMNNLARSSYEGTNVFIKNLNETIDDEELKNLFQPFGTITSAKVMRDGNGKSKEFGFVNFSKPEEATKAISKRNGFEFKGKVLYATLAQNKEERALILEERRIQKEIEMQTTKEMQKIGISHKQRLPQMLSVFPGNRVLTGQAVPQPPRMYSPRQNFILPTPLMPMWNTLFSQPPLFIKDNVHLPQRQGRAKYAAPVMTHAQGCEKNYFQSVGHSIECRRDGGRNTESASSEIGTSCERRNMSGAEKAKGHQDQKEKEKRESRRKRTKAAKVHEIENRNDQMKPKDLRSSTKRKEESKSVNCRDTKKIESCKRENKCRSERKPVHVRRFPTILQADSDDEDNILKITEARSLCSVESEDLSTRNKTIPDELFESTSSSDTDFDVKSAFICGENLIVGSSRDEKCTIKKVTSNLDSLEDLNKDQTVRKKSDDENLDDPKILLRIVAKKKDTKLPVATRLAAMKT